jgi:hypothetical protein
MSQPRFAPITAGLLARKGNAAPSSMTSSMASFTPMAAPPPPPKAVEPPPPSLAESQPSGEHDAHHKKLFVSLSHQEHERLAIAAVKTGLTRHQIVRDALDVYFDQLLADMGHECHCVSGTVCARSC